MLLMEEIDNIIVGSIEIPSVLEFPFLSIIKNVKMIHEPDV